jgi:hypothetical protein
MGASNFHYVNASRCFSICESYEMPVLDDDGNETDETETFYPDSDDFDCEIDNIKSILKEAGESFWGVETRSREELRSYPTTFIGTIYRQKSFGDIEVGIEVHCFARSGYYQGACLDYEVQLKIDGYEVDDVEEHFKTANSSMNEGMLTIQAKNAEKWASKAEAELANVAEAVFAKCSTQYTKVATFSNGETIYQKVS